MRRLRYDAVSYVLTNGNAFHRLKLAHVIGREYEYRTLVDELMSVQNRDGGWPWQLAVGNPSGVSDTAKILELLPSVSVDPASEPISRAVSYLLRLQNRDGGWSESPELDRIVPEDWTWVSTRDSGYQTADVINALLEIGHLGDEVERAIEFLRGMQNEEGGWPSHVGPDSSTDPATTDHIIMAFLRSGEPRGSPVIVRAERMLLEKRRGWDSPVDATAVLSVLLALGYPPEEEHVSELIGWLVDAQRPDGGWNWFGDLPSNPSQTVDCLEQLVRFVGVKRS